MNWFKKFNSLGKNIYRLTTNTFNSPNFQGSISEQNILYKEKKKWEKTFDAIDDWISIIDIDSTILRSNRAVESFFDVKLQEVIDVKCCKLLHGRDSPIKDCPLPKMIKTKKREWAEVQIEDGRWMNITVDPIFDASGRTISAVHSVREITDRVLIVDGKERLIEELQQALSHINTLSGLIPICSGCKKIRDDKGYWNIIESYIENRSEATFSHGICPECLDSLYGNEDWYNNMKKNSS